MQKSNPETAGQSVQICLPWPNRSLSPNARLHFREKAQWTKAAKGTGFLAAREADLQLPKTGALELDLVFCPPDHKRRDADNVLAALKGYIDGIFQWAETDDTRIKRIVIDWGEITPGGAVYASLFPEAQ